MYAPWGYLQFSEIAGTCSVCLVKTVYFCDNKSIIAIYRKESNRKECMQFMQKKEPFMPFFIL